MKKETQQNYLAFIEVRPPLPRAPPSRSKPFSLPRALQRVAIGCRDDSECPTNQACINEKCLNPCVARNPCSAKEDCKVQNQRATCVAGECEGPEEGMGEGKGMVKRREGRMGMGKGREGYGEGKGGYRDGEGREGIGKGREGGKAKVMGIEG